MLLCLLEFITKNLFSLGAPGLKGERGSSSASGTKGERGDLGAKGYVGPRGDPGKLPPGNRIEDFKGDQGNEKNNSVHCFSALLFIDFFERTSLKN